MVRNMQDLREKNFRYERKFLVDEMEPEQVRMLVRLHPALFYEPYPPRNINNFYLDSREMEKYYENVSGASDRTKVRVRWYHNLFGDINKPVLEFKVKRGLVGTKYSYPFAPFKVGRGFSSQDFRKAITISDLPQQVMRELRDLDIVLLNWYHRRYYATRDGRFRVTIDSDLTYYHVDNLRSGFLHHQEDRAHCIVELKYEKHLDPQANRVASYFPFRVTKNSKYVTGIEKVYF